MNPIMETALSKKLKDYASFTASILMFAGKTDAQVIYTDLEFDVVLDTDGYYYPLDIDANGTLDFHFFKTTNTYSTTYSNLNSFQALSVRHGFLNEVAGNSHYYPYSGNIFNFAYALNSFNLIGSTLLWQNDLHVFFAWKAWTGEYDNHCFDCYWNQPGEPEILDHFLGLRFADASNNYHYGWIRCDVKEDGSILVLKDYAFETEPNYPILAGSKTTYQEIEPGNIIGEIYASGNTIQINVPHRPTILFKINILNISGQCIYSTQSEDPFVEIQLDVPHGIYIVAVSSGNELLTKEILL